MTERPARIFYDGEAYTDLTQWHRVARGLRRDDPVHKVDYAEEYGPFWAVTRHAMWPRSNAGTTSF